MKTAALSFVQLLLDYHAAVTDNNLMEIRRLAAELRNRGINDRVLYQVAREATENRPTLQK